MHGRSMPTLKRNHRQILAARPIDGKRTRYRIEGLRGLWLSVGTTGAKSWIVRYQPGGRATRKFRWHKIGDVGSVGLSEAADRAEEILRQVKLDERDPSAERKASRVPQPTFGSLFEAWYTRHALPRLALPQDDKRKYDNHLKDEFGNRTLSTIKRTDVAQLRDELARTAGPILSNHVITLFNRVMNWAVDDGLIEFNPAARLRKVGQAKPRERILAAADIGRFWRALAALEEMTGEHIARGEPGRMLTPSTRSILRLLLLTGQRRGEVTNILKSELALADDEPVWTIPGARTKNKLLHRLPLCPMAIAEFGEAVARSPVTSPFVFPSPNDIRKPIGTSAVTRAMARLVAELGLPTVSPHDLRRTVGTELARLGLPIHVRSLVLNHSPLSRGITDAVYNRYAYDREKREALQAWEHRLSKLVSI
jgi:integrase